MAKFKVGDRVRIISTGYRTIIKIGDTGTVKGCSALGDYVVEFDRKSSSFTRCDGLTKRDRGLWISPEMLELIKDKPTREFKLIITSSGDTTTAKLIHGKDVAKEATVTRYSTDEYSEKAAVEAVVKKIFGEDEKKEMSMRDYEDLKDIDIPSIQKAMVKVMRDAYEDCRTSGCNGCSDWKRAHYKSIMSCILFKYARKLYEAGFVYAQEDVWSAYNDGYACGMEQGIEAERSRKG